MFLPLFIPRALFIQFTKAIRAPQMKPPAARSALNIQLDGARRELGKSARCSLVNPPVYVVVCFILIICPNSHLITLSSMARTGTPSCFNLQFLNRSDKSSVFPSAQSEDHAGCRCRNVKRHLWLEILSRRTKNKAEGSVRCLVPTRRVTSHLHPILDHALQFLLSAPQTLSQSLC